MLLGIGLTFVFYVIHTRFWAVPVKDERSGQLSLWIGGSANRNRDAFEQRFNELVAAAEKETKSITGLRRRASQPPSCVKRRQWGMKINND